MERNGVPVAVGGAVALVAVLLSLFGSKGPSSKQPSQNSLKDQNASELASAPSASNGIVETLARDNSGPWYAFCQEFEGDGVSAGTRPLSVQLDEVERTVSDNTGTHKYSVHQALTGDLKSCKGPTADLKFLITTLPDPIESHLDLEFDRFIESLTRAAAVRGYSFERYWLPWRPEQSGVVEETSAKNPSRYQESLRREQPGLLIYRKLPDQSSATDGKDHLLLIFLVGETPTGGLNRTAFLKAVRYIEEMHSPQNSSAKKEGLAIPVAGPSFSGTLPSLGETIVESVKYYTGPGNLTFDVVNYGARSGALIDQFQREIKPATLVSLDLRASQAEKAWEDYLQKLGYDSGEMAVLAEDGSAYGSAFSKATTEAGDGSTTPTKTADNETADKKHDNSATGDANQVVVLTFPRDLSAIRNLAENESANAPAQPIAGVNIPSIGVALTLRQDQTNEHDAPPDFAQAQSSARIDRALRGVVKTLRTRRIQAVLVTATNPLDRIFLLEYLHLTVPDVRLATVGADDFMLARPGHIDLSGTIAVTKLPLTENKMAVGSDTLPQSINFPSSTAEGVFLAAANLLGNNPAVLYKPTNAQCVDISIVGKTGFRQAVKNDGSSGTASPSNNRSYPCLGPKDTNANQSLASTVCDDSVRIGRVTPNHDQSGGGTGQQNGGASSSNPIPIVWIMALIALFVVSATHIALVCSSNELLGMGFLPKIARFAISASSVKEIQLFYLFFATSQILLLEWIAVTTTRALAAPSLGLLTAHKLLLAASLVLCAWLLVKVATGSVRRRRRVVEGGVIAALLFVVFTAVCWLFLLYSFPLNKDLAKLTAFRTVYFLEGLSPLLPVFFVLLAYYLWSLNCLQQLSLVVMRVTLSIPRDNKAAKELANRMSDLQASMRPHLDVDNSTVALIALTIVGCCFVRLWPALRGFEYFSIGSYNYWPLRLWFVSAGFSLLLLIVVIVFQRAWSIWLQMKKVLHSLDGALLGGAFSHLPKEMSSLRMWSLGSMRTSLMVQSRTAVLLRRMQEKYPAQRAQAAAAAAEGATESSASALGHNAEEDTPFSILRQLTRVLDTGGVVQRPLARKLSARLNCRMKQTGFLFSPDAAGSSTLPAGEKHLLELYVAYRFVAFFRYAMRQLRNKLTFVIYGFACLVVGTSVYPFQGRESLGTLMSFVFLLLLAGVAAMLIQIYRDPIFKRLEPPSTGFSETFEIATKLIGVAGVPLFAVLASQFPSLAEVLLNWLQPLLETSH